MDYDEYRMSPYNMVKYCLIYLAIILAVSYVFYDSPLAFLVFIPSVFLFIRFVKKELIRKRKDELKNVLFIMVKRKKRNDVIKLINNIDSSSIIITTNAFTFDYLNK